VIKPGKSIYTAAIAMLMAGGMQSAQAMSEAAKNFPNKPITIVIGYTAGGSTDIPFRVLAENLTGILKQPVIVENKPGAGGVLPAMQLHNKKPDGYTLAQTPTPVFRLPYISKIDWNPATDLTYVIGLAGYSFGLVVPADSPIKSMKEYIEYARTNPEKLTYGSPGIMTTLHITMEAIAQDADIKLVHVPYKGNAESLKAIIGGFVMSVADTPAWAPYVENGKLRLLSTWGENAAKNFLMRPPSKSQALTESSFLLSDWPFLKTPIRTSLKSFMTHSSWPWKNPIFAKRWKNMIWSRST
jgi:tripartite-type tricarboxylate transporter receptor subunit TctC